MPNEADRKREPYDADLLSPVNQQRLPPWFVDRLTDLDGPRKPWENIWMHLRRAVRVAGFDPHFLDHVGSTSYQGQDCLVSEPYLARISLSARHAAQEFAILIGADLYTLPTGWHHPECMRFLFIPLPEGHLRRVDVSDI